MSLTSDWGFLRSTGMIYTFVLGLDVPIESLPISYHKIINGLLRKRHRSASQAPFPQDTDSKINRHFQGDKTQQTVRR